MSLTGAGYSSELIMFWEEQGEEKMEGRVGGEARKLTINDIHAQSVLTQ